MNCNDPNGPAPCEGVNGTVTLNLTDYVDVSAATGTIVYSIVSYDTDFFQTLTIDGGTGVITIGLQGTGVDDAPAPYSTGEIVYRVNDTGSILSAVETITVCARNLCESACAEGTECNPCTGNCDPIVPDVELN